jgi:hypothetical protein
VYLIALIANGFGLTRLARSVRKGAQLDALRGGPLDKRGVGSRVLDAGGRINQLRAMMDANFARALGERRRIDRALMQGEWPILLRVMGKPSADGRYLSLTELRMRFVERRLSSRITRRLGKTTNAPSTNS